MFVICYDLLPVKYQQQEFDCQNWVFFSGTHIEQWIDFAKTSSWRTEKPSAGLTRVRISYYDKKSNRTCKIVVYGLISQRS